MKTHLKMIYKAIQIVFVGILVLTTLFVGIYGLSAFAQWRVSKQNKYTDVKVSISDLEQYKKVIKRL